ncbi:MULTISPECIES: Mu-like prophage major head subunit gpT family protein [Serratia]|uniref:Mu-like prophage major head subunit gpT family protein n=1 Tax=Serratia TaxID=613 RepID=UPI00066187E2|nr:Mu-like prophage major head subunit gpT family protein [Serratia sp. 506_PEND]HBC7419273.1 Mu-like prophage major head subunit gpT family protein [Serratia marcescens]
MIVNRRNLDLAFVNLRTIFNNAFSTAETQWQNVAMLVPSTTGTEDYAWLSDFPRMREWIGEKTLRSLAAFNYSLKNRDFEATVEVDRNDIKDDRLGIYGIKAQSAGQSAALWPDELVFELVNKAFETRCFDGQYFFDADHLVAGKSVSNMFTKPLSIASQAEARASFGAARTAMRKFKNDEGQPLKVNPNVLLVPPALEDIANTLMTTDRLEDGKPNLYKNAAKVVVSDELLSDTAWYLLDTTKPVKPFIFQEREKPEFVQQTSMDSDAVFLTKKFRFGCEARGESGFGFWQLAFGSTGDNS